MTAPLNLWSYDALEIIIIIIIKLITDADPVGQRG